jgi:ATP-dependent RNA helicase DeaD
MFSATMPRGIEALAKKYQNQAVRVNTVGAQKQHLDIEYRALVTASYDSENAIFNVLRYYDAINAIVFCGTREAVNRMTSRFANRGFNVVALSGELSQNERTHALQAMRDHRAQVCVATDVAARGIDLPDLELVIHADIPKNTEGLLHRSGRTGRAGRKGSSILIVPAKSRRRVERLLQDANVRAQWGAPPSADDVKQRDDERLLGDPLLQEPAQEREAGLIKALLARHSADQIAAAFVRLHRKGMAAPEDLEPPPPDRPERPDRAARPVRGERPERGARVERGERVERREWQDRPEHGQRPERAPRPPRDNFTQGVWIRLSVGRAQSAEARWLLPMLCKASGLTKRDIGAIRINDRETFVEIEPDSADGFFESIGPGGMLEKSIRVTRLDGAPEPDGGGPARKSAAKAPPRRASVDVPMDGEKPPRAAPAKPKPPYVSKRKAPPAPANSPTDGAAPRKKRKWTPDA